MFKNVIAAFLIVLIAGCTSTNDNSMTEHGEANKLINSTSPYLLQHAYNPVEWYPWGEEALARAKAEDKPIIVSIGYSSCHWCHVMERESFENDSIAAIMNANFINIKVDREERPDVDQIYMDAVQAMGQNGGWPLNVFLTPDQKPFYGGTYFPPNGWTQLLTNITDAFQNNRSELEASANKLTNALATSELIKYDLNPQDAEYTVERLDSMFQKMAARFDTELGGNDRAPKFPMPGSWNFLLQYHHYSGNQQALDQVLLTLNNIAFGGIYDQAGGGFARYSVDAEWLVPHFEKMLYDNGQLVSLYSQAFKLNQSTEYKKVVYQTVDWLKREMLDESGGFYAALDADSEGEEGKFYVWSKTEFDQLLGKDAQIMGLYYNIVEEGSWEDGKNILHRTLSEEQFATENNLSIAELSALVAATDKKLLDARANRIRPGLDDKVLSGWNGLMLTGLCDAYDAFGEPEFLSLAQNNAEFLLSEMIVDGKLSRSYKNGVSSIDGYLEDYAAVIEGFIALYQSTLDEKWIYAAQELMEYANTHFYDEKEKFYYFTDNESEALIARKKEVFDNVIPSSNSMMANNLYILGIIFDNEDYKEKSQAMLSSLVKLTISEPSYTYNWAKLYGFMTGNTAEVVIVGEELDSMRAQFASTYLPNKVLMGTNTSSQLPLLDQKSQLRDKTTVYVCYNKTCKLPVNDFESALKQIK